MKKIGVTMVAVFMAILQVVAFYGMLPIHVALYMYDWKTWRVANVTKFVVKAAAHTIADDFNEWYR